MADWQRTGACNQCGECCGSNGESPFVKLGWESVRTWSLDDINVSHPMFSMFGLALVGEDTIGLPAAEGFYRVKGTQYHYTWKNLGKGTVPYKDTSATHDGSIYSTECPFLKPDPGDGSRPCALDGTGDDGIRKQYCRPEERPEPPSDYDIWDQRSTDQWQADHPNCSYVFVEIIE